MRLSAGWTGLRFLVVANIFALMLTIGLFALLPVTTAWIHLKIDADTLAALHVRHGGWPQQLLDLRAGLVREVTPMSNFAIIGFPSYHCTAGLINMWAASRQALLRWPIVIATLPLIAATPVKGGHYIADLLGAIVVTLVAIAAARAFVGPARIMIFPALSTWRAQARGLIRASA